MLLLRRFLLLICVYCAAAQATKCNKVSKRTMTDIVELRRKIDYLLDLLKNYEPRVPTTTTTTTAEITTVPTTTTEKITTVPTTTTEKITIVPTTTTEKITTVPTTTTEKITTVSTTTTEKATTRKPPTTKPPVKYENCQQILDEGFADSGFYHVYVTGYARPITVFCDMDIDGGGWMVIQRRIDGLVDFNRTYAEYARGFGKPYDEFWMGNDAISALTLSTPMELRVELSDWEDEEVYAKYDRFVVEGANKNYQLSLGKYSGTAGDSLGYHDGNFFSAFDADNDQSAKSNCAMRHTGGWWFRRCMRSNLNGRYIEGGEYDSYADGVAWSRFRGLKYSLMFTEMKMRPSAVV